MLFSAINLFETTEFLPMLNIPTSDVVIDTDKAFMLRRIGTYAPKLKEEIVHSGVPINNLCDGSSSADVCLFTSHTTSTNIVELATILSPRDIVTALPRYDSFQFNPKRYKSNFSYSPS
ncbi:unnamed protein product [Didymodactylos carnosus]|uniref:Uncharacterized protein n=1 Tax=Didymodactylos carnosus TaxID=1234261 RepID=A0A8S2SNK4_9BILA|nr:unnamed protein product [Didymodactylos carnosus]CAF4243032.1 unnamed protein product [Didymodactylos carnosus]CAF4511169.1 unnamed protein product [Didymodactylos carnosus]